MKVDITLNSNLFKIKLDMKPNISDPFWLTKQIKTDGNYRSLEYLPKVFSDDIHRNPFTAIHTLITKYQFDHIIGTNRVGNMSIFYIVIPSLNVNLCISNRSMEEAKRIAALKIHRIYCKLIL